ncbi:MAG TPA: hypothetical protein VHD83_00015, partial [Puia sp.]|nr:hypothetical protein [Puia sp.]
GNCCIVIPKPGKKHVDSVPLMHPPIRSERVDGPANIRQTAHGRVLYTLYDDTPIYTSDSSGKWCAVAVLVGITKKEDDSFELREGTRLFWKGREIGKTLTRVPIDPIDIAGEGSNTYAILRGYTSLQNIKPQTMPEYVLHRLVQPGIPTTAYLHDFLQGFQFIQTTTFTTTTSGGYKTYQLDEACEPNHKGALRLLLAFDHDKLFAIVHHRALGPMPNKPSVLNRGYQLTIIGDQPATQVSDFTDKINHFINMAD